ncbi:MAG TPA: LutB/LldF family L-lactate oxidation iron-sulfur protein [Tepidisphaeraceae bacterium]|nr:LutB/LldF family L-lactate oxidation iron-sulfur protein [Tepidisphaeraceae bacterium]
MENSVKAFNFADASTSAAHDERLKNAVNNAVMRQYLARQDRLKELPDSDRLRTLAGEIKQHALDHLDYYLEQLKSAVERNGGHFHMVSTAEQARELILDIAKKAKCNSVIKSKSMVSEEIELAHEMERRGMDVVETDLGEFIVQISHDKPSHIVAPIVHKDKASVAKLFSEYFKTPYNDDPEFLTRQARAHLRDKFRRADFGMTGANFLVAETGQVCAVENEGNARQSITTPRVLVTLAGIEKIVPRLRDLSVMLKLLARSATGQPMTIYTNIFGGPRLAGEKDGPEEFHLVLLDGGRSEILAGEYRQTLRCIRCGACLNACPIYRKIGGHSYGHVYSGPIGALITPLLNGLEQYKDLPQASSLCGACYEACPVKIEIPKHLINLRRDINRRHLNSGIERFVYRAWAWGLRSPLLYGMIGALQKFDLRRRAKQTGWVQRLPRIASGWTDVRDMPAPAKKTFHEMWKKRGVR